MRSTVTTTTASERLKQEKLAKAVGVIGTCLAALHSAWLLSVVGYRLFQEGKPMEAMAVRVAGHSERFPEDQHASDALNDIIIRLLSKKSETEIMDCLVQIHIALKNSDTSLRVVLEFVGLDALKTECQKYFDTYLPQPHTYSHNSSYTSQQKVINDFINGAREAMLGAKVPVIDNLSSAEKAEIQDLCIAINTIPYDSRKSMETLGNLYLTSIGAQPMSIAAPAVNKQSTISTEFWIENSTEFADATITLHFGALKYTLKPGKTTDGNKIRMNIAREGGEIAAGALTFNGVDELKQAKIEMFYFQKYENTYNRTVNPVTGSWDPEIRYNRIDRPVIINIGDDVKPGSGAKMTLTLNNGFCYANVEQHNVAIKSSREIMLSILTNILADKSSELLCKWQDPLMNQQMQYLQTYQYSNAPRLVMEGKLDPSEVYNYAMKEAMGEFLNKAAVSQSLNGRVTNVPAEMKQKFRDIVINEITQQLAKFTDEEVEEARKTVVQARTGGDQAIMYALGRMFGYNVWYQAYYNIISAAIPSMSEAEKQKKADETVQATFSLFKPLPAPVVAGISTATTAAMRNTNSSNTVHATLNSEDTISAELDGVTHTLDDISISITTTTTTAMTTSTALSTSTVTTTNTTSTTIHATVTVSPQVGQLSQATGWQDKTSGQNQNKEDCILL